MVHEEEYSMEYKHLEVNTVRSLLPLAALLLVMQAKIRTHLVVIEVPSLQLMWELFLATHSFIECRCGD